MELEKLTRKLNIKDYNKELEKILIKKPFSKTTNNLLLSMLYKIENSYEDYKKVKVEVPSKSKFLEKLLTIIDDQCKEIEIVRPTIEEENALLQDKKSIAIQKEKKIIAYQNEVAILEAIYKLSSNDFYIESQEKIETEAISEILNVGEGIQQSEIIRDFDGWSWNVITDEIEDYNANLIYLGMVYLIGYETLEKNKKMTIKDLENLLKGEYKPAFVQNLLKMIRQIAILRYIKDRPDEKNNLQKKQEELQQYFNLMDDKKTYIEEITNQKKQYIKEIENIDKYINDDLALKKEYIRQNEKLPQDQRVFSLSDFSEKIVEKRKNLSLEIEKLTEILKPQNYVKEKGRLEQKLNFIKELNLENPDVNLFVKEFINLLLKALSIQIDKIELKKDIIDKMYILRYINLLNINKEITVGKEYKKQIDKVQKKLITKGCNLKALNIFSSNVEENYKIYKNIFETRIIDLESVYIEVTKENSVKIYDENSLEKENTNDEFNNLIIKYNKKIKIFQ